MSIDDFIDLDSLLCVHNQVIDMSKLDDPDLILLFHELTTSLEDAETELERRGL